MEIKTSLFRTSLVAISLIISIAACTPICPDTEEQQKQEIEDPEVEDENKQISMKMIVGEYTFDVEYAESSTAEAFKRYSL